MGDRELGAAHFSLGLGDSLRSPAAARTEVARGLLAAARAFGAGATRPGGHDAHALVAASRRCPAGHVTVGAGVGAGVVGARLGDADGASVLSQHGKCDPSAAGQHCCPAMKPSAAHRGCREQSDGRRGGVGDGVGGGWLRQHVM